MKKAYIFRLLTTGCGEPKYEEINLSTLSGRKLA